MPQEGSSTEGARYEFLVASPSVHGALSRHVRLRSTDDVYKTSMCLGGHVATRLATLGLGFRSLGLRV